jgi:hypothetical protein
MFSPAKAITAGALVFAIGGVLLIAQPFYQQGEGVPAAESTDLVEPVEFTLVIGQANKAGLPATCDVVDGVNHCRDARPPVAITEASDPRLDGQLTVSVSQIQYPDHPWFTTTTFRIFNDGGAWQGSGTMTEDVVLAGEGAYEGLYAWMDASDWNAISGVIYPTAPLEATDLSPLGTE